MADADKQNEHKGKIVSPPEPSSLFGRRFWLGVGATILVSVLSWVGYHTLERQEDTLPTVLKPPSPFTGPSGLPPLEPGGLVVPESLEAATGGGQTLPDAIVLPGSANDPIPTPVPPRKAAPPPPDAPPEFNGVADGDAPPPYHDASASSQGSAFTPGPNAPSAHAREPSLAVTEPSPAAESIPAWLSRAAPASVGGEPQQRVSPPEPAQAPQAEVGWLSRLLFGDPDDGKGPQPPLNRGSTPPPDRSPPFVQPASSASQVAGEPAPPRDARTDTTTSAPPAPDEGLPPQDTVASRGYRQQETAAGQPSSQSSGPAWMPPPAVPEGPAIVPPPDQPPPPGEPPPTPMPVTSPSRPEILPSSPLVATGAPEAGGPQADAAQGVDSGVDRPAPRLPAPDAARAVEDRPNLPPQGGWAGPDFDDLRPATPRGPSPPPPEGTRPSSAAAQTDTSPSFWSLLVGEATPLPDTRAPVPPPAKAPATPQKSWLERLFTAAPSDATPKSERRLEGALSGSVSLPQEENVSKEADSSLSRPPPGYWDWLFGNATVVEATPEPTAPRRSSSFYTRLWDWVLGDEDPDATPTPLPPRETAAEEAAAHASTAEVNPKGSLWDRLLAWLLKQDSPAPQETTVEGTSWWTKAWESIFDESTPGTTDPLQLEAVSRPEAPPGSVMQMLGAIPVARGVTAEQYLEHIYAALERKSVSVQGNTVPLRQELNSLHDTFIEVANIELELTELLPSGERPLAPPTLKTLPEVLSATNRLTLRLELLTVSTGGAEGYHVPVTFLPRPGREPSPLGAILPALEHMTQDPEVDRKILHAALERLEALEKRLTSLQSRLMSLPTSLRNIGVDARAEEEAPVPYVSPMPHLPFLPGVMVRISEQL